MFHDHFAPPLSRKRTAWVAHAGRLFGVLVLLFGLMGGIPRSAQSAAPSFPQVYTNPLSIQIPGGGQVESCADPSIIHGQGQDAYWYIFCTTDPLNGSDKNASGGFNFHLIPILRSLNLVNWEYVGDVFSTRPAWVAGGAGLWAPDIHFMNGQYYLYYTASGTSLPGGSSAIGVATSASPAGPWVDSGAPVVEPNGRWIYDPALITDDSGQNWIYYGSYFGGVYVRPLSADGLHADPAGQVMVTIANRYEGTFVVKKFGYYYLFGSATNCCNGPLTGYSVFVGRSASPTGPFVDREGVGLLDSRVGGTPVISMNGNRWVGPGHNAVFTDFAGQDWFLYHAVDQNNPYFDAAVGFTRRPVLMDALTWQDGWPSVRGGLWASDTPQLAPAAVPGAQTNVIPKPFKAAQPGALLSSFSDEFTGSALGSQWSWVRMPDPATFQVANGTFTFDTQAADVYVDSNNASVLVEDAPHGNYLVEAKLHVNYPADGCCQNYVQGGLLIYGGDDNFIKLADVSIWETRQTEFAKELAPVPPGYPRYGNTVGTAPGADWTYLRIAVETRSGDELYTAYTSRDGVFWNHSGTWTHHLGNTAKIGLFSMGGSGFTSTFDYVRVYTLNNGAQ